MFQLASKFFKVQIQKIIVIYAQIITHIVLKIKYFEDVMLKLNLAPKALNESH